MKKPVYEDLNYRERFDQHFAELTWIYGEIYRDETLLWELFQDMYSFYQKGVVKGAVYAELDMAYVSIMHEWAQKEPDYFISSEQETIPQLFWAGGFLGNFPYYPSIGKYMMTDSGTDQWNLNYRNPKVFQQMVGRLLEYTQKGTKVLLLKNLPHIWKELGTDCFDLPGVHKLLRLIRLIMEVACPEAELWAVLELEPERAAPYLGSRERPECHRIVLAGASEVIWHTLATRDTRLLKRQMDCFGGFSWNDQLVHMLWTGEDFQWRLDYTALKEWGMEKMAHRKYLNDYFTGISSGKWSITSMCGWEKAVEAKDEEWQKYALRRVLLLHAYLHILPGLPVLQLKDARKFSEELAVKLEKLSSLRKAETVLGADAVCRTMDVDENSILCVIRESGNEKLIGLFNFSEHEKMAWIDQRDGIYRDLISGEYIKPSGVKMPGNGCYWLKKERSL